MQRGVYPSVSTQDTDLKAAIKWGLSAFEGMILQISTNNDSRNANGWLMHSYSRFYQENIHLVGDTFDINGSVDFLKKILVKVIHRGTDSAGLSNFYALDLFAFAATTLKKSQLIPCCQNTFNPMKKPSQC